MSERDEEETPTSLEYATPLQQAEGLSSYEKAATKVGCVPSFLLGDNLISLGGGVAGAVALGLPSALVGMPSDNLLISVVLGFIGGVVLAGIVLAFVNLFRKR